MFVSSLQLCLICAIRLLKRMLYEQSTGFEGFCGSKSTHIQSIGIYWRFNQ
jgi:hypothetical protein